MTIQRKSLDYHYKTKLPSSTAVENRLQMYSPLTIRPSSNNRPELYKDGNRLKMYLDTRTYIREIVHEGIGRIIIKRVELTQAHKDVMETIFANYRHTGGFFDGQNITYNISRYSLLQKLGKSDSPNNYIWLEHIFEDLKDCEVQLELITTKAFGPRYGKKFKMEFNVLDSYGQSKEENNDKTYQLVFSQKFVDVFYCGISLFYHKLVKEIVQKSNGVVKALIRFCLANQFVPKQPIEELFEQLGVREPKFSASQISQYKNLFKPVLNAATGMEEDNEMVRQLWEDLCIRVTWEGRQCFVQYEKADLDKQNPHAVVFYNPMKPKIPRKELKQKQVKSDEAAGKRIMDEMKKSGGNNRNGAVFGDEPEDFD